MTAMVPLFVLLREDRFDELFAFGFTLMVFFLLKMRRKKRWMSEAGLATQPLPSFEAQLTSEDGGFDADGVSSWRNLSSWGLSISLETTPAVKPFSIAASRGDNQYSIHSRVSSSSIISQHHRPRSQEKPKTAGQQFFTLTCIQSERRWERWPFVELPSL